MMRSTEEDASSLQKKVLNLEYKKLLLKSTPGVGAKVLVIIP